MVGGELCWRGEIMWEGADEHFALLAGDGCRAIEAADAGRRICRHRHQAGYAGHAADAAVACCACRILRAALLAAAVALVIALLVRAEAGRCCCR